MWAEAISTANYLHAQSPTSSNNGMTAYEKLFGRKPEVGHLQHFRCKAFKSLPASHNSKFSTRAHPLFMLGYIHNSTTIWHFCDPDWRQVIQASNFTFIESVGLGLGASSKLNSSGGLGFDALTVGLGLSISNQLNSLGGLRLDTSEVGLGLGASNELNSLDGLGLDDLSVGLGLGISSEINALAVGLELGTLSELNSSDALGLDTLAVGLGLGASSERNTSVDRLRFGASSELNSSDRLALNALAVGLGLGTSSGLNSLGGLVLDVWSGSPANMEGNTSRHDLQKRSRTVAHQIWVEEEPIDSADPVSYREAIAHLRFGLKWSDAVDEELRSLAENSTWDYIGLEDIPVGIMPISSKWVFKTKELPGDGIRYKARLVFRGFEQQAGVNFDETFALVAKLQNLRMMLARATFYNWEI